MEATIENLTLAQRQRGTSKLKEKTKDRIVLCSIDLFNKSGVAAVTTNHIAKELDISPGNLYFHFRNKEEIIRQILRMMCAETYQVWRVKKGQTLAHPLKFIDQNYELFWKYRFIHREIFFLSRRDTQFNRLWRTHLAKIQRMMILVYKRWFRESWVLSIQSQSEIEFMATVLLATASNFLQYFEGSERLSAKEHLGRGKRYVTWLLMPWTQGSMREDFETFVFSGSFDPKFDAQFQMP